LHCIDPSFDPQDLLSLTYELFDEYQSRYPHILASQAQAPLPASSSSHGTSPYNAIAEYRKGIKRDPTVYEPIRDISQWTWWKRSFEATADAQGVTNVLDWNYSPRTTEDATLLEEQSKYVYSVLLKVIKAALLRSILSKFDSTTVREAWRTMVKAAERSTTAEIKAHELMEYTFSARLDNGLWKGTTLDFVLHWTEQVRQYEELGVHTLPDQVKVFTLQLAVDSIPELAQIRSTAQQTKQNLSFEDYHALLVSAATAYDKKHSAKRRPPLKALLHDTDVYDSEEGGYGIDTDVGTIYANAAMSQPARLPSERFRLLSDEARRYWASIPEKDRLLILQDSSSTTSSLTDNSKGRR